MASVKVAVRVRPFSQREIELGCVPIIRMEGKKTGIVNPSVNQRGDKDREMTAIKQFQFDHSYWSFEADDSGFADQKQVYNDLGKGLIEDAFEGYNACIFAYGQTGSGKTFTMMGTPGNEGLIPRICAQLFNRMKAERLKGSSFRTEVSYLEIYNERVKDLLSKSANNSHTGGGLKVREHPKNGPYVENLSKHLVTDFADISELMARGNSYRTTAATGMNDTSSRSHAIFTVAFSQASFSKDTPHETLSKINLVDLAGSERANATGATGQRLIEGCHINKSLVTLGSVIKALADLSSKSSKAATTGGGGGGPKNVFIPYRDSVLTWLLKDSLGGNSKTVMIAALSPADVNYQETLSTLRYASRAKSIVNKPTINEDTNTKLIRDLRSEIERLKSLLLENPTENPMIEKLQQNEAKVQKLTEEWTEKWKETQRILKEQRTLGLRKSGLGVVLDSELPHLVGIDDDLLSTGITLYHLRDGQTRIGTGLCSEKQDICLNGMDIEDAHCVIELTKGKARLTPVDKSPCFVNNIQIDRPTALSQGCVILLGSNTVFRYNDPLEVERLRREKERGSTLNLFSSSRLFSPHGSCRDLWTSATAFGHFDDSVGDTNANRITAEEVVMKREELERLRAESDKLKQAVRETQEKLLALKQEQESILEWNQRRHQKESNLGKGESREECYGANARREPAEGEENDSDSNERYLRFTGNFCRKERRIVCGSHESTAATMSDDDEGSSSVASSDGNGPYQHDRKPSILAELNSLQSKVDALNTMASRDIVTLQGRVPFSTTKQFDEGDEDEKVSLAAEFLKSKFEELKAFERRLFQMETDLRERERRELDGRGGGLDDVIEEEVKKRLSLRQSLLELSWREELEHGLLSNENLNEQNQTLAPATSTPNLGRARRAELAFEHQDIDRSRGSLNLVNESTQFDESFFSSQSPFQRNSATSCSNATDSQIEITIERFVLVGAGCDAHHEYEVDIRLGTVKFTIYRRYRKFLELHQMIGKRYASSGRQATSLTLPYFPPKKWFGQRSEYVAEGRRKCLERYLQKLLTLGQTLDGCPLNWRQLGQKKLERDNLTRFSSFFREDGVRFPPEE